MFTPLGLFKDIPCPQGEQCPLLACVFSHNLVDNASVEKDVQNTDTASKEPTIANDQPAAKRIKLDQTIEPNTPKTKSKNAPGNGDKAQAAVSSNQPSDRQRPTSQTKLKSASRPISPPPRAEKTPVKRDTASTTVVPGQTESHPPRRAVKKERLNPRMVTKAPAPHGVRSSILAKLHASMSALNQKLDGDKKGSEQYLVLSPDELVAMALDEEEKAARESPGIYSNVIKLRIVKLTKMSKDNWAEEVKTHLNTKYYKIEPNKQVQKPKTLDTGLTVKEETAIASILLTPVQGLETFGYVTKAPTKEEVDNATKGVLESKGWEKCERCGGRFQVFPGRREDGSLTSGGQCTYHPGKPLYPSRNRTDHITGPKETYFSCCNESIGTSAGCTKGKTHVFKVSEPKRLASILQFEETPTQQGKGSLQPVCFDCEMGYTTNGLELIRVTAVSWPQGKGLLDVLVRPMGEVLDLNSRFSGVFPEHYTNARPYGTPAPKTLSSEDGEIEEATLQVADSPSAARALLFQYLQPDTPLIGHAIDNDLNACRIIHPTIIDTAILYPAPRNGLPHGPNRMSLKTLSRKYLDRDIQTGGSRGHDSKEDSLATGDLVRVKASETWKTLKTKGWTIQDDKLIPPPGMAKTENKTTAVALGPGAGQKRKDSNG